MNRAGACVTIAVAAAVAGAAFAQTGRLGAHSVVSIRRTNSAGATRISIEVTGEFEYRGDHLHDPERVYFDILNARPRFDGKRLFHEEVDDPLVKQIRAAETSPGITRVVFDLSVPVDVKASVLKGPDRLMVEMRPSAHPATAPTVTVAPPVAPGPIPAVMTAPPVPIAPPVTKAEPAVPRVVTVTAETPKIEGPKPLTPRADAPKPEAAKPAVPKADPAPAPPEPIAIPVALTSTVSSTPAAAAPVTVPTSTTSVTATTSSTTAGPVIPKAARRTTDGDTSLVRALGLKLQRIVIDPGHGGHDEGTRGPKGLLEKDLVLDVSLRLGKLIQERMGAEVIYTRSDDTFIPLEGRTALANDKKADLFLSIHANSSPAPRITGVETYYLNFTDSQDAMEVATRENAGSQQSIFDLRDLIQKISLHDKASESRDFAERIQSALFTFSSRTFPSEKNRGVKKAPFVVLIGANMPSVLAEIGFISNPREEALLKRPDYRQKLAEALYRGVSKYAESLSHFQMAAN